MEFKYITDLNFNKVKLLSTLGGVSTCCHGQKWWRMLTVTFCPTEDKKDSFILNASLTCT